MPIDPNVVKITDPQAAQLGRWLEANGKVVGWINGFGLGKSYLDPRAAGGADTDGRRAYVKFDHEIAEEVPTLRGQSVAAIRDYLETRAALTSADVSAPTVDVKAGDIVLYRRTGKTHASAAPPPDGLPIRIEDVRVAKGKPFFLSVRTLYSQTAWRISPHEVAAFGPDETPDGAELAILRTLHGDRAGQKHFDALMKVHANLVASGVSKSVDEDRIVREPVAALSP